MKFITRETAISLLESKGASRELIEKQENYYINVLLVTTKLDSVIHPPIGESELKQIINDIVSHTEELLEVKLSDNNFKNKVWELVNQCNSDQLQEMYCKILNNERAINFNINNQ